MADNGRKRVKKPILTAKDAKFQGCHDDYPSAHKRGVNRPSRRNDKLKDCDPKILEAIKHITNTIETLRSATGLSVSALAVEAEISENTLKYIFKKEGYPTISVLIRLCNVFKLPLSEFFLIAEGKDQYGQQRSRELLESFEKLSSRHKALLLYIAKELGKQ